MDHHDRERESLRRLLRRELTTSLTATLFDFGFTALASLGRLHPMARLERQGLRRVRDVAYREGARREHLLDVYVPAGEGPWPVAIYLHGGSFRILSKDSHWPAGVQLSRAGYLTFNVNYRLSPAHRFPAALDDVSEAYRWIVEHAAHYGGDVGRLVLAGESAGANLVTALTVASCWERPEPAARRVWRTGVVPRVAMPVCGILQVSEPARFGKVQRLSPWVMARIAGVGAAYLPPGEKDGLELADPLCVIERAGAQARPLPAFFLAAGTRDPILDDTRRLATAVRRLGGACEERYYDGEPHAFHLLLSRAQAQAFWRDALGFASRHAADGSSM